MIPDDLGPRGRSSGQAALPSTDAKVALLRAIQALEIKALLEF